MRVRRVMSFWWSFRVCGEDGACCCGAYKKVQKRGFGTRRRLSFLPIPILSFLSLLKLTQHEDLVFLFIPGTSGQTSSVSSSVSVTMFSGEWRWPHSRCRFLADSDLDSLSSTHSPSIQRILFSMIWIFSHSFHRAPAGQIPYTFYQLELQDQLEINTASIKGKEYESFFRPDLFVYPGDFEKI